MLLSLKVFSQETKNNFIYIEALGNAGYYSLNYEKSISKSQYYRSYIRSGLSITYDNWIKPLHPTKKFTYFLTYNVPILFGTEVGTKNLKYEYGLGIDVSVGENVRHYNMLTLNKNSRYGITPTGLIGLRYYSKNYPTLFRLTLTPFYDIGVKKIIPLWAGASIGYKF